MTKKIIPPQFLVGVVNQGGVGEGSPKDSILW